MPRTAKLSKAALSRELAAVFESYGYEGASLSMLAKAAGLSKASLYHHFPRGKEDMAAHVLGVAGARLQALVLAPLNSATEAVERLHESLKGTATYYAGEVPVCLMNSLLVGSGHTLFASEIAAAVDVWQRGLAESYREAGASGAEASAWASYAVERIQGALILCKVKQSRLPLDTCLGELAADVDALKSQ